MRRRRANKISIRVEAYAEPSIGLSKALEMGDELDTNSHVKTIERGTPINSSGAGRKG